VSASTQFEKLKSLNDLDAQAAFAALERCCGSSRWVEQMLLLRPFKDKEALLQSADDVWGKLGKDDWLEAFRHHPKIGDINSLREKFASTSQWAQGEQKGVEQASEEILLGLARGNDHYEKRFGYIFIVCATGKSAGEMLALLQERLPNEPEYELHVAMQEQAKITRIRLEKLLA
jgi:2-oxo-4-hydroxy-4-carboxy-5-ureidoimidazoline decarboxylase